MGFQNLEDKTKKLVNWGYFSTAFHIVATTLLGLYLPVSFLLLARLSCYSYLTTFTSIPLSLPSFLSWWLEHISPAILYFVISILSAAALVHGLTAKIALLSDQPTDAIYRPKLYVAWTLLCTVQLCVGLGMEGTIAAGIEGFGSNGSTGRSLFSRAIFFLGLHETMLLWTRTVVRPVVDDAVFGEAREEWWLQKVAAALCFGGLWSWRLREEAESLALVAEAKKELVLGLSLADYAGWWLYYLTVTIGLVGIVKAVLWAGSVLVLTRTSVEVNGNCNDIPGREDKV